MYSLLVTLHPSKLPPPLPNPGVTNIFICCLHRFAFLDISHKRNHTICSFFFLSFFFFFLLNKQAYLCGLLSFTLLCFTDIAFFFFFFYKLKSCGISALSKHISTIFYSICSLCVSVSHFGISLNISNFLIITVFVMVICDKILMLPLHKDYNSLKAR